MSETKGALAAAQGRIRLVSKASPKLLAGFSQISAVATADGQFSHAQKELVAVAIAIVQGCTDCIHYHADAAIRHGAKEAQLVEMIDVAVEMGGGPALMYGGKALEIFRALKG